MISACLDWACLLALRLMLCIMIMLASVHIGNDRVLALVHIVNDKMPRYCVHISDDRMHVHINNDSTRGEIWSLDHWTCLAMLSRAQINKT